MSNNRKLKLQLGNMLVSGPKAIHQTGSVGTSYVEASTSLLLNDASFSKFRSCRIYCDACGDDESGYLTPLVRITEWDRGSDIKLLDTQWPNISIRLLEIGLDCPILQNEIVTLQKLIDTQMFKSYGLPTRRNFGDEKLGSHGILRIETSAGWQDLSRDFWLGESSTFLNTFDSLCTIAGDIGSPADLSQWVERYEHSPDILSSGKWWDWNYKPQA